VLILQILNIIIMLFFCNFHFQHLIQFYKALKTQVFLYVNSGLQLFLFSDVQGENLSL